MIDRSRTPSGVPGPGRFLLQPFNAIASEGFTGWLAQQRVAIALTTGDRLMLIGLGGDGGLRIDELALDGAAGMAVDGARTLWIAGRWRLHRFEQVLADGETDDAGHDRLFCEQSTTTTGQIGCRDIAVGADGAPRFTSTLFNCVAMPSRRHHFTAVWRPPFVSAYVGEDRAHVTGLALEHGEPAYVTCAAASDARDGWRAALHDGGVVLDARSGEVVAERLSLPHSPRLHGGALYITSGGRGELCAVDRSDRSVEAIARVPGLARGLALHGRFALLGCSRVRADEPYCATEVGARRETEQRHAIAVIDLDRGAVVHELELLAASGQNYSVAVIAETAYGGVTDSAGGLREHIAIGPFHSVQRG